MPRATAPNAAGGPFATTLANNSSTDKSLVLCDFLFLQVLAGEARIGSQRRRPGDDQVETRSSSDLLCALLSELFHAMLLIIEDSRREGECAWHSHMG